MKKTKVVTKLIAIILSILVVVQVAPMSTFAETIETESEKFEESGYSTEVSQEEEDPIVIGEDVDRRDSSNTKYFKMSDGTIKAAVYKDPVLYQDSAGKWQEIDNTLETSDNEEINMTNSEFMNILNDDSLELTVEELENIIEEELQKDESEMDPDLIEYCLYYISKAETEGGK